MTDPSPITRRTFLEAVGIAGVGASSFGSVAATSSTSKLPSSSTESSAEQSSPQLRIEGQRQFDVGVGAELTSICAVERGGYLICGKSYHNHNADETASDGLLLKIDENGVLEWTQTYGGETANSIAAVTDGPEDTYLFAGSTHAGDSDSTAGWVGNVAADGTLRWEKTYGAAQPDTFSSIVPTAGGYLIAGTTQSEASPRHAGWITKIDSTGDPLWQRVYGGEQRDRINTMIQGADGSSLLGGDTRSLGQEHMDGWLLNVGADGAVRWQQHIGGTRQDQFKTAIQTADDGYLCAGISGSNSDRNRDAWVVKIAPDGQQEWDYTFHSAAFDSVPILLEIAPMEYAAFVRSSTSSADQSLRLIQLDAHGHRVTQESEQVLSRRDGDLLTDIVRTDAGGYYIVGYSWNLTDDSWPQPWLLRLRTDAGSGSFDPRDHGFGFDNWHGETGYDATGDEFHLELAVPSRREVASRIRNEWPTVTGSDQIDALSQIVHAELARRDISAGHCLGMVSAADEYQTLPDRLPSSVETASEVPHPTGEYQPVGELIREYQTGQLLDSEVFWTQLALGYDRIDTEAHLQAIRDAIDLTGTAPIALCRNPGTLKQNYYHQVLAYRYRPGDESGTIAIDVYDPEDTAERYRADSPEVNYAYDMPRHSLTLSASTGELLEYADYDSYAYLDTKSVPQVERLADSAAPVDEALDEALFVGLASPARLHVELPDGTTLRPASRTQSQPLVASKYSDVAWSFSVPSGDYTIDVIGDGRGDYTLDVVAANRTGSVIDTSYSESITSDDSHSFKLSVPESPTEESSFTRTDSPSVSSFIDSDGRIESGLDQIRDHSLPVSPTRLVAGSALVGGLGTGLGYAYAKNAEK